MSKELEYARGLLAEAESKRDRISGALTVRKNTVRNYWSFLAGLKGAIAAFSQNGKSTAPLRQLYREKLVDLKEHEMMVMNLRGMYKDACDELWINDCLVRKLES